jgi:hypothetical protein
LTDIAEVSSCGLINLTKNQLPDGAPAPTMQHLHYPGTSSWHPARKMTNASQSAPQKLMLGVYQNYMMVTTPGFDITPRAVDGEEAT